MKKPLEVTERNGKLFLSGEFARAGEPNANGVIYPREALEKALAAARPLVEDRRMMGVMGQDGPDVPLARISHLVTRLELEGDELTGEVELLPTGEGKRVETLLRCGGQVTAAGRWVGTLRDNVVQPDDLRLVSYDLSPVDPEPAEPKR